MKLFGFRFNRAIVAFVHDVIMAAVSFAAALWLRLGNDGWDFAVRYPEELVAALALFTAVCAGVFWFTGLYRGIWRYASMQDLVAIVRAVTLALLIFLPVTFLATRLEGLPRSFLVIDWFVLIFLLGAPRMVYRVFKDHSLDHLLERHSRPYVPVLLVGAGDAAELFIRDVHRDRHAAYEVVAVIDEKGGRVGRRIRGIPVMGDLPRLDAVVEDLREHGRMPRRVIVTKGLEREQMAALLDLADAKGMTLARLPRLTEFKSGTQAGADEADVRRPLQLRPVAIEDLLGRTQASLDRAAMRRLIESRRVLVTGAGGSIGSELARQAAEYAPAALTLLDNAESLLYAIDLEVAERYPQLPRRAVLADVRERAELDRVMAEVRPEVVLHAAALKHVPLVEENPTAAVLTNVVGTRNVAEACRQADVTAMVQVSTDKAVNPTGVMGASKRLAESYCQALDLAERRHGHGRGTRFVTVRFGNVLGSTGSVVPLFQRQLAAGGPLTVTHPDMSRYFMTLREAVQLVLQASALGLQGTEAEEEAGKIYVLDMGDPVKIADLAHQMIRLAGLQPGRDVEIVYTGIRPGEKLHEELFHDGEPMLATSHPQLKLAGARTGNLELLNRSLDELAELARAGQVEETLALLRRLVPEYRGASDAERGHAAAAS